MEPEDIKEYKEGHRTIVFNLCNLRYKDQTKFIQMYQNAIRNGIDGVKFVKTWNHYAKDISEHVFWSIKPEPNATFTKRGK
jgi:hypothetical protein